MLRGSERPAWASIERELLEINGRKGAILASTTLGVRELRVPVLIECNNNQELHLLEEDLSEWLITDQPCPLIFHDEPDRVYYAVVSGELNFKSLVTAGEGEITFICPDPHKYSAQEKIYPFPPTNEELFYVENLGGTETYPKITLEFTENIANFAIMKDEDFLMFGTGDVDKVPMDPRPVILREDFSTLNGWTAASSVDEGTITGSFASNGSAIRPSIWGTGAGWHGPSLVKGLTKQLQNFHMRCRFGNRATRVGQLGRVEVYFLDVNGNKIGKIALRNGNPNAITPLAQGRVKNNYVVNTYGNYAGAWKNWNDGFMDVTRTGNKWRFYFAMYDFEEGREHTRYTFEWVDAKGTATEKLAQVQVHIGAHGTSPGPETIFITDLKVNEIIGSGTGETPYLFMAGDVLEIDNNKGSIFLNGQPYYESLNPASRFIALEKGLNAITFHPLSFRNGELSYRERWL